MFELLLGDTRFQQKTWKIGLPDLKKNVYFTALITASHKQVTEAILYNSISSAPAHPAYLFNHREGWQASQNGW